MKGIALSKIEHGVADKDGKNNAVKVFNEGDEIDMPEKELMALVDAKAAALPPGKKG